MVSCQSCNVTIGEYAPTAGMPKCAVVQPGFIIAAGLASVSRCAPGYLAVDFTKCVACDSGFYSPDPATSFLLHNNTCQACPAGRFQAINTVGNSGCELCPGACMWPAKMDVV